MNRRRILVVTACIAGAAVLGTGGVLLAQGSERPADADALSRSLSTGSATVERGDLNGTSTKQGKLHGTPGVTVPGGPEGTLTSIPSVGDVIKPRDDLYRVDNTPVVYFSGVLPQWRAFEQGMDDGPDIQQLEENLFAWGYLDEVATRHFDWHTRVAIEKWQKDTGQKVTGTIEQGRIWFGLGDQVVSERKLPVGSTVSPGTPVYDTQGTTKIVTVNLPVGSPLLRLGGRVTVVLPTGPRVAGKVEALGDPVTDDDGTTTTPVTIGSLDSSKIGDLDRVDVTVDFVSQTRKDVLSVPVTALGAASDGGFVVEVIGTAGATKSVPVTVGLFAGERVEVTGGALKAGDKVVVPT
ncbi:peptidoglycan-binding protein [Frondihabitans sp. 4ASC-45]|uniref:peptidoglycan-binding protein n=1 Tax=Frondihabitans sp. 4ASC-45 TaxID=3111636 RepID=UPI003C1FDF8F